MPFDLRRTLQEAERHGRADFTNSVNPEWAKALKIIGFDRRYVRAEGASLWDDEGLEYLDLIAGYATANIGRNHPVVCKALADYLGSKAPSMVQFETPALAGLLAADLTQRVGRGLGRVFFTNSGTEGIEACIKFARCATGRAGLLATHGCFHGLTTGSLSINGCVSFRDGFGPYPESARLIPFNDLAALERALSGRDVAAFVVEPIQGKGVNLPSTGYLAEASRICRRHGTLFVADEVQTGVGRTGSFLAIDQEGDVEPDMVVLSKALSAGHVPVGAVLVRNRVWEATFSRLDRAIVHSSTFHMGGLAMVAALATLSVYDDEGLASNARSVGARLASAIEERCKKFEMFRKVRQRGLMIGIEFGAPTSLRLRAAWKLAQALDPNLLMQAITIPMIEDHRILSQVAGHGLPVLKLTPPLTLTRSQADRFAEALVAVLERAHGNLGPGMVLLKRLTTNVIRPTRSGPSVYTSHDA